ncbi:MAG: endolytic transglycosylase MltG, partial [Gemmatimonadota bacterium]
YKDLDVDSPYNTYRRAGLPPGPICSPGTASIEAAFYPIAGSGEFFFVANGDGTHTFSETFSEHVKARQRIEREREAKEFPLDTGEGG